MSNRRTIPGAVGLLAAASVLLSACGGGATVAKPTPLDELEAPAYRMQTLWQTDAGAGAGEFVSGFGVVIHCRDQYVLNQDRGAWPPWPCQDRLHQFCQRPGFANRHDLRTDCVVGGVEADGEVQSAKARACSEFTEKSDALRISDSRYGDV